MFGWVKRLLKPEKPQVTVRRATLFEQMLIESMREDRHIWLVTKRAENGDQIGYCGSVTAFDDQYVTMLRWREWKQDEPPIEILVNRSHITALMWSEDEHAKVFKRFASVMNKLYSTEGEAQ